MSRDARRKEALVEPLLEALGAAFGCTLHGLPLEVDGASTEESTQRLVSVPTLGGDRLSISSPVIPADTLRLSDGLVEGLLRPRDADVHVLEAVPKRQRLRHSELLLARPPGGGRQNVVL